MASCKLKVANGKLQVIVDIRGRFVLLSPPLRGVAQLVGHLLWEQDAASSSLATPTIFDRYRAILSLIPAFYYY